MNKVFTFFYFWIPSPQMDICCFSVYTVEMLFLTSSLVQQKHCRVPRIHFQVHYSVLSCLTAVQHCSASLSDLAGCVQTSASLSHLVLWRLVLTSDVFVHLSDCLWPGTVAESLLNVLFSDSSLFWLAWIV